MVTRCEILPTEVWSCHADRSNTARAENTKRPCDLFKSAERALRHRLFTRAEALLREAIKQHPEAAEPRHLMGVLHEMRNKKGAARKEYRAALWIDHGYEPARLHLAKLEDDAWA